MLNLPEPGFFTCSVQFSRSVVSDSLRPHELQHTMPPGPSPTPGVHPNLCPSSRWCHPTISSCHPLLLPSIFPSIRVSSNEIVRVWECCTTLFVNGTSFARVIVQWSIHYVVIWHVLITVICPPQFTLQKCFHIFPSSITVPIKK